VHFHVISIPGGTTFDRSTIHFAADESFSPRMNPSSHSTTLSVDESRARTKRIERRLDIVGSNVNKDVNKLGRLKKKVSPGLRFPSSTRGTPTTGSAQRRLL